MIKTTGLSEKNFVDVLSEGMKEVRRRIHMEKSLRKGQEIFYRRGNKDRGNET